ncbi:MAG TPA: hypothetical protein VM076_25435 [Gemmatimonadaceae bacterium]|nr:hypothetical protein [Gemmatimonadaceae bacterium]
MRSAYPAVFLCAIACASAPSASRLSTSGTPLAAASLPVSGSERISRGQFLTGSFMTDYFAGEMLSDALRRRAPIYLRSRVNPSGELSGRMDPIAVYINGSFSGSLEVLSSIPAYEVFSVDRLAAADASIRFGPKHGSGALMVTLVRHD